MNNWLKNSLLLVRGACYTHFSPFLLSYLRYSPSSFSYSFFTSGFAPCPVPRPAFLFFPFRSPFPLFIVIFIPTPRLPFHFRLSLFNLAFPIHPSPGTREKWRASGCSWSGCQGNIFLCDPANFARSIFRVPTFSSFPLTDSLEQRDSSNCLTYSWIMYEFC